MSIVSLPFTAFVAAVLLVYHVLPRRAQAGWLLVASYAFYGLNAWRFVPVLALVTAATIGLGGRLTADRTHCTHWLWVGIAVNLTALFACRWLYHAEPFAGPFVVVGLSFYALQAISYLADLHSGRLKQSRPPSEVALYLAYFPKLVAGPIERAHAFCPQLTRPGAVDDARFARALALIAVGLTRKLVLADPLAALLPTDVFTAPRHYGSLALAGYLVGYAVMLYNDFAGYTGIVRGVSLLFGIELSANFAQPFFARSFTEFWNRWHITLSLWLRDYIYLPTSRALLRRNPSLRNVPNVIAPPLLAMLASAVWHEASLNMLLWGALHGCYLVGERTLSLLHPTAPAATRPTWRQVAGALAVFVLGTWAFAAFRVQWPVLAQYWSRLLDATRAAPPDGRLLLYVGPSLWLDWLQYRHGDETAAFLHWPRPARAALASGAILLWFLFTRHQHAAPFVYQGF